MSQVISTVNDLKDRNNGLNQRIRSIESTLSNSQGEMQIKINLIQYHSILFHTII